MKIKPILFSIIALAILATSVKADLTVIYPNTTVNGSYSQWTSLNCPSTSKGECIDEVVLNTSDYLYTPFNSYSQSFKMINGAPLLIDIHNITVKFVATRYNSTNTMFQPLLRIGFTDHTTFAITTDSKWKNYTKTYNTNPSSGNKWNYTDLSTTEFGFKSYTSNPGAKIAMMHVIVDHNYTTSCIDYDGMSTNTSSYVWGYFNNTQYYHADSCKNSTHVIERYCSSTINLNTTISCVGNGTSSCSFGLCI